MLMMRLLLTKIMSSPLSVGSTKDADPASAGLGGLEEARSSMSDSGAEYASAALENWPAAQDAERRLPSSF